MHVSQAEVLDFARFLRVFKNFRSKLVRIGSFGDGGYVIDEPSGSIPFVLSLGIDREVSFDLHFANLNIPVYQFDPSIEEPPFKHRHFHFSKLAISHQSSTTAISINDVISKIGNKTDNAILKFDIEGHEWLSLAFTDKLHIKGFQTIVGEFHFLEAIETRQYYDLFISVLSLLSSTHTLTHFHPNNNTGVCVVQGVVLPRLVELTWRRKDIGIFTPDLNACLTPLDHPCAPDKPEIILPSYWGI